jgi:hypothetical protein
MGQHRPEVLSRLEVPYCRVPSHQLPDDYLLRDQVQQPRLADCLRILKHCLLSAVAV